MKKQESRVVDHTLDSFYRKNSKVLILGTMPSAKSRELGFYYMHPQNRFWRVLSQVFEEALPETVEEKRQFLIKHKIALWDVIQTCTITGSSDSSIKNVVPNDILWILGQTKIKKIYTTGKTAHRLYQKYCYKTTLIEDVVLLSPSPANCAFSLDDMINDYQQIKEDVI